MAVTDKAEAAIFQELPLREEAQPVVAGRIRKDLQEEKVEDSDHEERMDPIPRKLKLCPFDQLR